MSEDSIDGILDTLERSAVLCHYNGDIGFNVHCIRAKNTPIRGTGGVSNGLVPMLKAYNTSIATVSRKIQNGKNVEQITIYLEPWHADIFEFLDLKKNIGYYFLLFFLVHIFYDTFIHIYKCFLMLTIIGEEKLRAKDMFYALWTPDLFMERVFSDDIWSLMCPHECPDLIETYGEEFELLYTR